MSKSRLSTFAVGTTDWMKYRPYERLTDYDAFYLRLANRVFDELNHRESFIREILHREGIIELAVVLVSWLEDYANEIGLWSALVRKNKALYGYELPFFQTGPYDPDALNREDLAYLMWHFCCKARGSFIAPEAPGILPMSERIVQIFDHALDDAPGTDFYEEYLTIPDDIPFFELKSKLRWMAFNNYLIGPEFERAFQEQIDQVMKERQGLMSAFEDPGKLIYMMQDEFLYQQRTSFLAFSVPEWLAEVVQASDRLKSDLPVLTRHFFGEFVFEDSDEQYYHFRHLYTRRLFEVRKESVSIKGIHPGDAVFTSLVNWQGAWWVTGTLSGLGSAARSPEPSDPSTVSFYAWSETQQTRLRETEANMEAAYLEYFGDRMVFFKNERQLEEAMQAEQAHYNATKTTGESPRTSLPPDRQELYRQQSRDLLQDLNWQRGVAAFYEPGAGVKISPELARIAYLLEQPEITREQAHQLFFTLFSRCSPASIRYLLSKHGSRNLRPPTSTTIRLEQYLDFMMRFFNPNAFGEKLPNTTLMPEN